MKLNFFGFFRELVHGDPEGPSIRELVQPDAQPDEGALADYFDGCSVLAITSQLADDVLNPAEVGVAQVCTRTDGEWIWPGDLGYYVRTYHVEVPPALVERARSFAFVPPTLSHEDLVEVENRFFAEQTG